MKTQAPPSEKEKLLDSSVAIARAVAAISRRDIKAKLWAAKLFDLKIKMKVACEHNK